MIKCILKDDIFVDKEVEIDSHRNIIEVVRNTAELKESPDYIGKAGYIAASYSFKGYASGVGIYSGGEK